MDPVFGSPKWIRTWVTTNKAPTPPVISAQYPRKRGAVENPNKALRYSGPGRGVQGESTNSQSTNDKQILKKTWRPSTP